jgi:hypothetical protein
MIFCQDIDERSLRAIWFLAYLTCFATSVCIHLRSASRSYSLSSRLTVRPFDFADVTLRINRV